MADQPTVSEGFTAVLLATALFGHTLWRAVRARFR